MFCMQGNDTCAPWETMPGCSFQRQARLVAKNLPASAGDADSVASIPGSGRSLEWRRSSVQYSCLERSMDRGACQATVHGAAESYTRLSTHIIASKDSCSSISHPAVLFCKVSLPFPL